MLVTGGSGYLGAELVRQAGRRALGTFHTRRFPGGVRLDVRNTVAVADAVTGQDAVVHTAYVQDDESVIVDGSAVVAAACAAHGARLVHVSTDVVFDGLLGRAYTEDDEPTPITDYGRAKLEAERAVARICPDAAIVRTSLIYGGPGREPSRQERDAIDDTMPFFTDELRSPIHVGDLAAALIELAAGERRGVLHVGGADSVSRYEHAQLVVAARGGDADTVRSASFRELGLTRPADCTLDSTRAERLLSTRLRGVREVLAVRS